MTLLEVSGLKVTYGGAVLACEGVSLTVDEGGSVCLLGANGAGKTSVLRAITGLLRYHNGAVVQGSITFDGRSIIGADTSKLVASGIAQALEGRRIFRDLTVTDNLRAGAFSARDRSREKRVRDEVLQLFPPLAARLGQAAGYLSGGEQQMLAIARAMMAQPRLLILDEPSLGLAPLVVEHIGASLREIVAGGCSLMMVEQSTAMALATTSYAYLLENGCVTHHDRTARLLADERVRASYLGTSAGQAEVAAVAGEKAR